MKTHRDASTAVDLVALVPIKLPSSESLGLVSVATKPTITCPADEVTCLLGSVESGGGWVDASCAGGSEIIGNSSLQKRSSCQGEHEEQVYSQWINNNDSSSWR